MDSRSLDNLGLTWRHGAPRMPAYHEQQSKPRMRRLCAGFGLGAVMATFVPWPILDSRLGILWATSAQFDRLNVRN